MAWFMVLLALALVAPAGSADARILTNSFAPTGKLIGHDEAVVVTVLIKCTEGTVQVDVEVFQPPGAYGIGQSSAPCTGQLTVDRVTVASLRGTFAPGESTICGRAVNREHPGNDLDTVDWCRGTPVELS
jgi:hypothetical protein